MKLLKIYLCVLMAVGAALCARGGVGVKLTGGDSAHKVIELEAPKATGLGGVFVVWSSQGMTAEYTAANAANAVKWSRFSSLGGGFAQEMPAVRSGAVSRAGLVAGDMGYIVEESTPSGSRFTYFWVTDYSTHRCSLQALEVNGDAQECTRTALNFTGEAGKISYYSINGAQQTLSRDLTVDYNTLKFNAETRQFNQVAETATLAAAEGVIRVDAPLCQTAFTLSGDRFLREWGMEQEVTSPAVDPVAIAVETDARQEERSIDNEQREEKAQSLGGSGPVEITFTATCSDAVIYREWQFATDPAFDIIDIRMQEDEVTRTFREQGTMYVRFVAGNRSGSCDFTSETYTVYIGESRLECPNVFSPEATPGTNDEWKVSYKSIVEFDCTIVNRWGQPVAHLTHPSQGWNGKYNGKFVPSGVYYYVIKARGTDGKSYNLTGDINIVKFTDTRTSSSASQN